MGYFSLDTTGITKANIREKYSMMNMSRDLRRYSPSLDEVMRGFGLGGDGSIEWQCSDYLQNFKNRLLRFITEQVDKAVQWVTKQVAGVIETALTSIKTRIMSLFRKEIAKKQEIDMEKHADFIQIISAAAFNGIWIQSYYSGSWIRMMTAVGDKNLMFEKFKNFVDVVIQDANELSVLDAQQKKIIVNKGVNLDFAGMNTADGITANKNVVEKLKKYRTLESGNLLTCSQIALAANLSEVEQKTDFIVTSPILQDQLLRDDPFKRGNKEFSTFEEKQNKTDLLNDDMSHKIYQTYLNEIKSSVVPSEPTSYDPADTIPTASQFYDHMVQIDSRYNPTQTYRWFADINFNQYCQPTTSKPKFFHEAFDFGNKVFIQNNEITFFLQNMIIPNMTIETVNAITTEFGYMPLPEPKLLTDQQTFSMDLIDTNQPIFENFFLPWMQEVTADTYIYSHRPYMKADITITYFVSPYMVKDGSLKDVTFLQYTFYGCYPYDIGTRSVSQNASGSVDTRAVRFQFETLSVAQNKKAMKTAYGR